MHNTEKAALDPAVRAYMASLAGQRKRVAGICRQCGAAFTRTRAAKFCSDACRLRAFQPKRKRNKTASAETPSAS